MTFDEAMEAVANGARVRRATWQTACYAYLQSKTAILFCDHGSFKRQRFLCIDGRASDTPYGVSDEEMKATDWEVL